MFFMRLGIIAPLVLGTSGFARAGRQIMFGLAKQGVEIRLYLDNPKYDRVCSKEEYAQLLQFSQNKFQPDTWFNLAPQCHFSLGPEHSGYKIGMSMFETYTNPPVYASRSQILDELWVPSAFCYHVFNQTSAIPKEKLSWMPLGVDTNLYSPRPSKYKLTDIDKRSYDFVYGIICGYSNRKGIDLVLTAHQELFTTTDNAALCIKGDHYGERLFAKDMQVLYSGDLLIHEAAVTPEVRREIAAKTLVNRPKILYSFESYSDAEIVEVLLAMDGLVFPSRGEGFGLPPLEAMACGLPVVGSMSTGMADFISEDVAYPVKSNGRRPDSDCDWITTDYRGREFADPDYIQYRDAVWDMYTNRDVAKEKGRKAREYVVKNFGLDIITARMKKRLDEIEAGKRTTEGFEPPDVPW